MSGIEIVALTTVALFLKMVAVAMLQGYIRKSTDTFAKPEDADCYGSGEVSQEEHPLADRAQRTLHNDLENIPIFLFLAWGLVQLNAGLEQLPIYTAVFTASRIIHSATYLKPMQPYRTLAYVVGSLVSLAMAAQIVLTIF